jgi:hypothetical protein
MNDMVNGYLYCALWADLHDDEGNSIDDKDITDCTDDMIEQAIKDCENFKELAMDLIPSYIEKFDESQMGHDFWLTRNGHGAGFWDRGLEQLGKDLTNVAKTFSTCDIWLNDGGKVECN